MSQVLKIQLLQSNLQQLCSELGINYAEHADPPTDREIYLAFRYEEEGLADKLIKEMRIRYASFGPEYWLSKCHPGGFLFRDEEHLQYRVDKSLITSHLYWGVSFILCEGEEGYSLQERVTA